MLEIVGTHFLLVLQKHISISDNAFGSSSPNKVEHRLDVLKIHSDPLKSISQLARHGIAFKPTNLLEIGELGDFHTV